MPLFSRSLMGDLGNVSSEYWWDALHVFFFDICLSLNGALQGGGAPFDMYWWGAGKHRKPGLWRLPSSFSTYSPGAKTYVSAKLPPTFRSIAPMTCPCRDGGDEGRETDVCSGSWLAGFTTWSHKSPYLPYERRGGVVLLLMWTLKS